MTYTPGPWKFVRASKSGINQENDHLIYNEQKRHIAEVFQYQEHEFIISLSEAEANARLIAAAPEMLEILKQVKMDIEFESLGLGDLKKRIGQALRRVSDGR